MNMDPQFDRIHGHKRRFIGYMFWFCCDCIFGFWSYSEPGPVLSQMIDSDFCSFAETPTTSLPLPGTMLPKLPPPAQTFPQFSIQIHDLH